MQIFVRPNRIPIWGAVTAILVLGPLLASTLATMILDAFLEGPGPSSVTTRVPGFVYASATVMKVSISAGVLTLLTRLVSRAVVRFKQNATRPTSGPSSMVFPCWGITASALAPITPFVGALGVLTAQALTQTRGSLSMADMSQISRTAVILMLSLIAVGVVAAAIGLLTRERPVPLSALALVTNVLLIVLFWHFEFYALGFHQDAWAPR